MKYLSKFDFLFNKEDSEAIDSLEAYYKDGVFERGFIQNYTYKRLKDFWEKHLKLKKDVINLITKYFMWSVNLKEKQFDKLFLENFGFQCCKLCEKKMLEINNISNPDV